MYLSVCNGPIPPLCVSCIHAISIFWVLMVCECVCVCISSSVRSVSVFIDAILSIRWPESRVAEKELIFAFY